MIKYWKEQIDLIIKVLTGKFPPDKPTTWLMKSILFLLIFLRLFSVGQNLIQPFQKKNRNGFSDFYMCVCLFILIIYLLFIPTEKIALIVTIYILTDFYIVTLAVILVNKHIEDHYIHSHERSAIFVFWGYIEVIIGFAIFYLYTSSLVFNLNSTHEPVNLAKDALYFSTVTITTLGFGDIVPINNTGRFLVVIETFIGITLIVFILAHFIAGIKHLKEYSEMKNNNKSNKLEGKLVESFKIEGLGDIAADYAELGIDLITKEGVLRDIPIVGTLVNAAKAVGSVRDRLYLRKLVLFLEKVGETTQEQKEKFIEDNCKNVKQFEEAVLLILEQADNMEKSSLIGKIFKSCILGKISYQDALTLSAMVNRAFWNDLQSLFNTDRNYEKERDKGARLLGAGLCYVSEPQSVMSQEFDYVYNDSAKLLIKINNEKYEDL